MSTLLPGEAMDVALQLLDDAGVHSYLRTANAPILVHHGILDVASVPSTDHMASLSYEGVSLAVGVIFQLWDLKLAVKQSAGA